jgi:Flp pilus assembly protein TadB
MNVNIRDLTASDFPGIDEAKFNEWKALKIKKNRKRRIVFYIGVGILLILSVVSILTAKPIFLAMFFILPFLLFEDLIVLYSIRYRHLRQLGEELKMSARLRAKKKGQAFTG